MAGASRSLTATPPRVIITWMRAIARPARHVVFVLAFALAFGPVATCLATVVSAEPAMPCHGTEQHPAPADSARMDCCPGEAPNTQSSIPVSQTVDSSAPSQVLLAVLPVLGTPQHGVRAGTVDAAAGSPRPPGIATYALISFYRI